MSTLILGLLLAASPSPDPPAPLPQFRPGSYDVVQVSVAYRMEFRKDGTYTAVPLDPEKADYFGLWRWDANTRTLTVHETARGASNICRWTTRFDEKMRPDWGTFEPLRDSR